MKVAALIPYWIDYHKMSEGHSNLKKLGGSYLINYAIKLLKRVPRIDEIFIYASNDSVMQLIDEKDGFTYLQRPSWLDNKSVVIEDIIDSFIQQVETENVVLLHPNSPFLQTATISDCLAPVLAGEYDSAFTACKYPKFCWYKGKPLNYVFTENTPRPSEVEPIFIEQGSLYVFSTNAYKANRKRVSPHPYIKCIDHFEGHEINADEDFQIAELIVNAGMFSEI
tara:strand:- start:481 stop:1152 length:672 start_codon:yes stop_codon:yes gene_type:complete